MCPKLIELLSWNGPTVHVCCFMLARASTKTFVSRVQKQRKKSSLAVSLVSRGYYYTNHEITQQITRKLLRMDVLTSETRWALNN